MKRRFNAAVILAVLAIGIPMVEPTFAQSTVLLPGNPIVATFGDWRFLNATIQYEAYPSPLALVLFAVWKDSAGQTVALNTCGVSMAIGETTTCYVPIFNVTPGTYNVYLFVISFPYNDPVSIAVTVQVTI